MTITIPEDYEVQPLKGASQHLPEGATTCGTCGLTWDDDIVTGITPAPAGRCPFEAFHEAEEPSTSITITVTRTIEVTDNVCHDVLTTAVEGGSSQFVWTSVQRSQDPAEYAAVVWAEVVDADDLEEAVRLIHAWDAQDPDERCGERPAPAKIHRLDESAVRLGLRRFGAWVAQDPKHARSYLGRQWSEGLAEGFEYLDALGADAVLQFAVYGEVLYG